MAFADAAAVFGGVLVLSFGLTLLLSGMFTSYFGAGKSRRIGLGLTILGLLTLSAWTIVTFNVQLFPMTPAWTDEQMGVGVAALVAGGIGSVAGLVLFLVAIMRA